MGPAETGFSLGFTRAVHHKTGGASLKGLEWNGGQVSRRAYDQYPMSLRWCMGSGSSRGAGGNTSTSLLLLLPRAQAHLWRAATSDGRQQAPNNAFQQ